MLLSIVILNTIVLVYKKQCEISPGVVLSTCFLDFQIKNNFFPFFLEIARNFTNVSYKPLPSAIQLSIFFKELK